MKKGVAHSKVRGHRKAPKKVRGHREAPKKPPDLAIRGCQCPGQEHFPSTVGLNFGEAPQ